MVSKSSNGGRGCLAGWVMSTFMFMNITFGLYALDRRSYKFLCTDGVDPLGFGENGRVNMTYGLISITYIEV